MCNVIYRYLDCGDLHCGFARVRCDQCGHEYLLAFSCKRRHFCPSCHQKRVVAFSERLVGQVLKQVPHRQWVFAIPKRLRIHFLFDRTLLAKLSRCACKVLKLYLRQGCAGDQAMRFAHHHLSMPNPIQHAVWGLALTYNRAFDIVAFKKSKFLSFIFLN